MLVPSARDARCKSSESRQDALTDTDSKLSRLIAAVMASNPVANAYLAALQSGASTTSIDSESSHLERL